MPKEKVDSLKVADVMEGGAPFLFVGANRVWKVIQVGKETRLTRATKKDILRMGSTPTNTGG